MGDRVPRPGGVGAHPPGGVGAHPPGGEGGGR
jgi:hypothetical protein